MGDGDAVRKILFVFAALLLLSAAACAQAVPTAEGPAQTLDFFGGYAVGHADFGNPGRLTGWDGSLSMRFASWLGAEANMNEINGVSTNYTKANMRLFTGAAGPKIMHSFLHRRVTPWGHALFGVSRVQSIAPQLYKYDSPDRAMDFGVGIDVNVTRLISIRPGQYDLLQTETGPHGATNAYYSAGVVFHLPL
jgi:hypothetical protein